MGGERNGERNGFWAKVTSIVAGALVVAFLVSFIAAKVWAHEGRIIRLETQYDSIMEGLKRIEEKLP